MISKEFIRDILFGCNGFEDFFVKASYLKTRMNISELKSLACVLDEEDFGYSEDAIVYLKDTIISEIVLNPKPADFNEKETVAKKKVVENFQKIFPNYDFVKEEYTVPNVGRIDILAKDRATGRDVVIELKTGSKNPNKQLISYATGFENPILIGITQQEISQKHERIQYFTYQELGVEF